MVKRNVAAVPVNVLADRLDTLLHTIRCIAEHEDDLCALLHEARKNSRLSAQGAADLKRLLDTMPAEEYAWQLHALEMELEQPIHAAA